jgi:hypothetical protein
VSSTVSCSSDQRRGVHAEVGQDGGDRERVGDVGVAGLAALASVLLLGHVVGALKQGQVGLGVQFTVDRGEGFEDLLDQRGTLRGDAPREPGAHPAGRRRRPGRVRGLRGHARVNVLTHPRS